MKLKRETKMNLVIIIATFILCHEVCGDSNHALGKPTCQSSGTKTDSQKVVDGNSATCTTTDKQAKPWWNVDLENVVVVERVVVTKTGNGFENLRILVGFDDKNIEQNCICAQDSAPRDGPTQAFLCKRKIAGQFVFIQSKRNEQLILCEVEVFGNDENRAIGRPTQQSSTRKGASASRAVDGNTNGAFSAGSCTHTYKELEPWWMVEFDSRTTVRVVEISNRLEASNRLRNFEITVDNQLCLREPSIAPAIKEYQCNQPLVGNSLRIQIKDRTEYLTLCEVKVFSALCENIAASKGTSQSSTDNAALPSRAVDGDRNSDFGQGSCSSTETSAKEWWQVDLGDSFDVTNLLVVTPKNGDCLQFDIFEVLVGENEHEWKGKDSLVCRKNIKIFRGKITGFLCDCPIKGRYVRIQRKGKGKLMLCEVEVFSKDALKEKGGKNARCVANDCDKEKLRPRKPVRKS